ncbi:MAG: porin [Nitrospirae bacterium]|nr:porin [Nitrospirota bacterium]
MKKVLAALAVIAVSSFGSIGFAAEGEAPVVKGTIEVYGAAKLSVDMITTDARTAGSDNSLTKVSTNSSRLGFKGKEELSDNLSAVMQIELGINYDGSQTSTVASVSSATTNTTTGATTVNTKSASIDKITYRNSYAGLSSKTFGMLLFGIHDTPYKVSTGSLDAFGDTMGDYNAIMGNVNGTSDFDLRSKDTIMYTSPKVGGVQIMAQISTTGQESDTSTVGNKSEHSFAASYSGGPVYVALANEVHKNGYGSLDKLGYNIEGTKLGAGVTLGGTKVGLVYEALKDGVSDSKNTRNALYIAASQKLGDETIKIAYGKADDGKDPNTKTGATLTTVGVDHSFSKRTTAYVLYAKTNNDAAAAYGLGQSGAGGAYTPKAGESPSVIAFGLNHSF